MSTPFEFRLNRIQNILFEAEKTLEENKANLDDETIRQRELFIAKLKEEEKEILESIGAVEKSDKPKSSRKKTGKGKKKGNKKEDEDKKDDKKG